jgi:stearoyl-CoA desaturase (delta-9 desaturase)
MPRQQNKRSKPARPWMSMLRWFDSEAGIEVIEATDERRVDWYRILPFIFLHVMCLGVIWVGWSPIAVGVAAILYFVRMFAITGFYHRYFSHKTYKTNRFWQFVFAVLGNSSVQRGPLWWAAHHRHHHRFTDQPQDAHSPARHGFWWSHMGWLTSRANFPTQMKYVQDWAKFTELRWINRYDTVIPVLLAIALFISGRLLEVYAPELGTSGMQMLIWGFFISTTVHFHAVVTINSMAHMFGSRRYDTPDTSRNNWLLSLITLGEGWHNNHHHYAVCARQGFYWWEIDITYYVLVVLSWLGIIRDLRPLPGKIRESGKLGQAAAGTG